MIQRVKRNLLLESRGDSSMAHFILNLNSRLASGFSWCIPLRAASCSLKPAFRNLTSSSLSLTLFSSPPLARKAPLQPTTQSTCRAFHNLKLPAPPPLVLGKAVRSLQMCLSFQNTELETQCVTHLTFLVISL